MDSVPILTSCNKTARSRGFTLVEMLVVLAIIAVITTIVVSGQSNYNKTLLLTDTAYDLALSAREAQTFGLGSRKFGSVQNPGYGLHFTSAIPDSYVLFADTAHTLPIVPGCQLGVPGTPEAKPGDCRYDAANDGTVNTYSFSRGFTIQKFCGVTSSYQSYCSTGGTLTTLDAVFTRPNTSATISGLVNGTTLTNFRCGEVTLTDASGESTRTIRFSNLGEVSVNQSCL